MTETVIGIDLGGTNIKSVLLDAATFRVLAKNQRPTGADGGVARVVANIAAAVRDQLAAAGRRGLRVMAVGVGSAGLVDGGVVRNSPNLPGWQAAVPLLRLLRGQLPGVRLPLTLDNDVNCFVVAEQRIGAARGCLDVIGLTLGTGVGGGIVIDGRLYRGSTGGAGELGHVVIDRRGPRCKCGNSGCLEILVGSPAIVRRYHGHLSAARLPARPVTVADIASRAGTGDRCAKKALEETGRLLGVGLANYVNIFNPQMIVIGGGVAQAGDLIITPAIKEMKARAMPYNSKAVKIEAARLGPWAGAIGAGIIAVTD